MKAYKTFTHDLRPPVQGGDPVWDGTLPYSLPKVEVDTSDDECGRGWNACRDIETALRIGGLWPGGRPSRVYVVESTCAVIERQDNLRAATWDVVAEVSEACISQAIARQTAGWAGEHAARMTAEQIDWRRALAQPGHDLEAVESGLRRALDSRGLDWGLQRYCSSWDACDAWDARDAWATRDVWAAWDAWAAWATRAARDAWRAWAARASRDALVAWGAWAVRASRAARDARDALVVIYAALVGWTEHDPDLLTTGLRDAYQHGLAIALPTGPGELGWAT